MSSWLEGLDRYLTSEPDCSFDVFCEAVTESVTESFFNDNEDWIMDNNGICTDWLNKLSRKIEDPKVAAVIIERAFKLYRITLTN